MKNLRLIIILTTTLFYTATAFAYDFEVGGIYYNITSDTDSTAEVTFNGKKSTYSGKITIPSKVSHKGKEYYVTSIKDSTFQYCRVLNSITIPDKIQYIGKSAFYGCTGLKSVIILSDVASIGKSAFAQCSELTNITIKGGLDSIGDYAFYGCKKLSKFIIPQNTEYLGTCAFYYCTSLKSIKIPTRTISIGTKVFAGCTELENIIVEDNNPIYDSRKGCNAIIETATNKLVQGCKKSVIPDNVTSIGDNAFHNCINLSMIKIPESVTHIGNSAFSECSGLLSITIPKNVTCICDSAFYGCRNLSRIVSHIPADKLFAISDNVFSDVKKDCKLYVTKGDMSVYTKTAGWKNYFTRTSKKPTKSKMRF